MKIGWNFTRHGGIITRMPRNLAYPLVLLAAALAACASPPPPGQTGIGTLQLRERIDIEPGKATARLQYGRIVASNAVQEHDPFCVFEIDSVRPHAQSVPPGQFRVTAMSHSVSSIASLRPGPVDTWSVRRVLNDDDMPTHLYYKTSFRLSNTDPQAIPQVRTLTCMSNQNMPGTAVFMRHLTPAEIREALGNWFILNLDLRA